MRILATASHVALALWVGAVFGIGIFVAAPAFRELGTETAAGFLGPIFGRIDRFGLVTASGLVLCLTDWRRWVAAAMGVGAGVSVFYLAPRVDGRNAYHIAAEMVWTGILVAGVVMLAYGASRSRTQAPSTSA